MEEIRIICTPFIVTAIVATLVMLYYDLSWKKKNPWWRQNDGEMRLSAAEKAYRQEERRKLNNALMCWFAVLFIIIGLMLLTLSAYARGGFAQIGAYWFYLVPVAGMVVLAVSGMKRRK